MMVQEWLQLLDKENAATFHSEERLLVCMFHLTTALYWKDEAPINSQKYQLRAAAHVAAQYEEIIELDSIYHRTGGVTAATRAVTHVMDTTDEFEQVRNLHEALECLYGSWYDHKYGKENETSG